jgi:hypothetical protein
MNIYIRFDKNGKQIETGNYPEMPEGNNWKEAPADFSWEKVYVLENETPKALTRAEKEAMNLELVKARKIMNVKLKAAQVINTVAPEWKQRNLLVQATEALEAGNAIPAEVKAVWDMTKAIRIFSNQLEQEVIDATTIEQVQSVAIESLESVAA